MKTTPIKKKVNWTHLKHLKLTTERVLNIFFLNQNFLNFSRSYLQKKNGHEIFKWLSFYPLMPYVENLIKNLFFDGWIRF